MSRTVIFTNKFKKDYKQAIKKKLDISKLDEVILLLAEDENLPKKYYDHALTGNWIGFRECHIEPDWLLIYKKNDKVLTLILSRTGSHSDLF